ncbi:hypothetical protein LINGRAHAP2_LOCUS17793 [Linum grandiflorum]
MIGLNIAREKGYRRVQVQLDSRCALQLIRRVTRKIHQYIAMVDKIRELMRRAWEFESIHAHREGNHATD